MIIRNSKNGLITNAEIYGLDRTKKTCQYPMNIGEEIKDKDTLYRLSRAKLGSGHDCATKGVIIRYDIEAPAYFWQQWQRYHFSDIVSSQSKMHRLHKMKLDEQCNKWVNDATMLNIKGLLEEYHNKPSTDNYMKLLSNTPLGFNLKADCVSNLLQEKTKYHQRRQHKLPEWQEYCNWLKNDVFEHLGFEIK